MSKADIMQLVCPACGCFGSVETFAAHADAVVVAALLGAMPPDVAAAMQRYIRLFAPPKHAMTWRRARRVLEPLAPLIEARSITVRGREWPAPHAAWIAAINAMLESAMRTDTTLRLPLRSNGYLMTVLVSGADKAESRAEVAVEEARRGRATMPIGAEADPRLDPHLDAAHTRTAVAMLVAEATAYRTRLRLVFSDTDAQQLLERRGFAAAVITAALSAWKELPR